MNVSGNPIANAANIILKGGATQGPSGGLGVFAVSTSPNSSPSDIAKAAALTYHLDVDGEYNPVRGRKWARRKKIKSKFSKKTSEEEDIDDPDVDEATGEGPVPNELRHEKRLKIHIAKQAQYNADIYSR